MKRSFPDIPHITKEQQPHNERKTASVPLLTNTYSASIGRIVTHYYSKNKKKLQECVFLPSLTAGPKTSFISPYGTILPSQVCFLALFFVGLFRIVDLIFDKLQLYIRAACCVLRTSFRFLHRTLNAEL